MYTTTTRSLCLAITFLAIGAMSACSSNASTTSPEEEVERDLGEQADQAPDITGDWLSACTPDGQGTFFVLDFDIASERWDLDYIVYGDEGCETKNVTVAIAGPYELTKRSDRVDDAWEATFGFDTKTVTPHHEGMASFLNSDQGCRQGWASGETMDIYDAQGCPALGQYPSTQCQKDYDLVLLSEQGLMFGQRPADNDMCQPDKRPTAMSGLVLTRP